MLWSWAGAMPAVRLRQPRRAVVRARFYLRIRLKPLAKCPATQRLAGWARGIWSVKLMRLTALWPALRMQRPFTSRCSICPRDQRFGGRAPRRIGGFIAKRCRRYSATSQASRLWPAGLRGWSLTRQARLLRSSPAMASVSAAGRRSSLPAHSYVAKSI